MLESMQEIIEAVSDALVLDGEEQLFVVGGAVRDELAMLPINDIDFTTDLLPKEIWARLESAATDPASRIMNVYDVGMEQGGTVGTMIDRSPMEPMRVEITPMRAETYPSGDRRRPEVVFGDNIIEDLGRRDFTINAMAYNVHTGHLVDPYGGVKDMHDKVLRMVADANQRVIDDPVRILRAARFLSKFEIAPDRDLIVAVEQNCDLLSGETPERIFKELKEILKAVGVFRGMSFLYSTGAMDVFLPEVSRLAGLDQPEKYHDHDVLRHTLYSMNAGAYAGAGVYMMLSILFHDLGKYDTYDNTSGTPHFYGHEERSEAIAKSIMERWKASNEETDIVCHVVRNHMRPHNTDFSNDVAVRKFVKKCDLMKEDRCLVSAEDICMHAMFDSLGSAKTKVFTAPIVYDTQIHSVEKARAYLPPVDEDLCPLDGRQIMTILGVEPGQVVGEAKKHIANLVIEGVIEPGDGKAAAEKLLIWFYDYRIGAEAS